MLEKLIAILLRTLLIMCVAASAFANTALVPDRRRPQFQYEQGYYVFPMPFSIPGVGEGIGAMGIAMNVGGASTDLFGVVLAGDLQGEVLGVGDFHLVPRTLILDLFSINFNKASVTNYEKRGMETDKHDFSYLQFGNYVIRRRTGYGDVRGPEIRSLLRRVQDPRRAG